MRSGDVSMPPHESVSSVTRRVSRAMLCDDVTCMWWIITGG